MNRISDSANAIFAGTAHSIFVFFVLKVNQIVQV